MTDDRMALARYRHRRFLRWTAAVMGVTMLLAFLGTLILVDAADGEDDTSLTVTVLLAGIPLLIMLVVFGGFYLASRRGVWWLQASPAWAVSWSDRRRIGKAVRSGQQLSGFEQTVALDIARRMTLQVYFFPIFALAVAFNLVTAIIEGELRGIVFWSAMAVLATFTAVVIWWEARRGRRYRAAAARA